jgi:hypothetical protein
MNPIAQRQGSLKGFPITLALPLGVWTKGMGDSFQIQGEFDTKTRYLLDFSQR